MTDPTSRAILNIRPDIPTALIKADMSPEERFQNKTLRPVIKLQHDLFIRVFIHYFHRKKDVFFNLSVERRANYIELIFLKDSLFKRELKGIITGLFTLEEYDYYAANEAVINKRMMTILKKRILDTIEAFKGPEDL